jgi:protein involved in polysaccharide export with SLBB domain
MGLWRAAGVQAAGIVVTGIVVAALGGCALVPPNSFLDPTKVGRFGLDPHEGGVRRVLTPRDTPPGVAGATEPTPADSVPAFEEYRITTGDLINVTIQDLLTPGQPYQVAYEVSALGEIRVPEIGVVRIGGLSEQEVEQEIAARLRDNGVLPRPIVQVFSQTRRGRIFNILGAVTQPGQYQIQEPDFRLLDAIGTAGDVAANAKKIYVIRRTATAPPELGPAEPATTPPARSKPTRTPEPLIVPPPEEVSPGAAPAFGVAPRYEDVPPGGRETPSTRELEEVLAPPPAKPGPEPAPKTGATQPFEPIIFDPQTGEVLEAPPPGGTAPPPREDSTGVEPKPGVDRKSLEEPFAWEDLEVPPLEQRVIAVDVAELKNGNPRFNIVVRSRDVINVPTDTGVFYVVGEITRPGVYAFGGRDITIKQALAIVGGFSPLAWPGRCEVVRREPGTDKQLTITVNLDAIYAGLEDDFYLRDDDVVNVGSHIVAPFLFVIRNSFRFTYGFGFVYDRNFADRDSYSNKINPEIIEQQRRAQRGLSF